MSLSLSTGTIAIAMVKRQVMIVQATRPHTKRDKYLDVHTYSPFGERVFLASALPEARISSSDILAVLSAPAGDSQTQPCVLAQGVFGVLEALFEVPEKARAYVVRLDFEPLNGLVGAGATVPL
ncbi:hypothetical protein AX17_004129 [Amanita inopinata Kibby_2008]|nr:hypothetical protein AX17_004129 [Amanita inopinata Kibby_2008]